MLNWKREFKDEFEEIANVCIKIESGIISPAEYLDIYKKAVFQRYLENPNSTNNMSKEAIESKARSFADRVTEARIENIDIVMNKLKATPETKKDLESVSSAIVSIFNSKSKMSKAIKTVVFTKRYSKSYDRLLKVAVSFQ